MSSVNDALRTWSTKDLAVNLSNELFPNNVPRYGYDLTAIKNGDLHIMIGEFLSRQEFDDEFVVDVFINVARMYGSPYYFSRASRHELPSKNSKLYEAWAWIEWEAKKPLSRCLSRLDEGLKAGAQPSELLEATRTKLKEVAQQPTPVIVTTPDAHAGVSVVTPLPTVFSASATSAPPLPTVTPSIAQMPALVSVAAPIGPLSQKSNVLFSSAPSVQVVKRDILSTRTRQSLSQRKDQREEATASFGGAVEEYASNVHESEKRDSGRLLTESVRKSLQLRDSAKESLIAPATLPVRNSSTHSSTHTHSSALSTTGSTAVQTSVPSSASMGTLQFPPLESVNNAMWTSQASLYVYGVVLAGRPFGIVGEIGKGGSAAVFQLKALGPSLEDCKNIDEAHLVWKHIVQNTAIMFSTAGVEDFAEGVSSTPLHSLASNTSVALKRVAIASPSQFETFSKEVALLQRLVGSRHVIALFGAFNVDPFVSRLSGHIFETHIFDRTRPRPKELWIALEFAQLKFPDVVSATLSLNCLRRLTRQLCEALVVVRKKGIIHADFKPMNVLSHFDEKLPVATCSNRFYKELKEFHPLSTADSLFEDHTQEDDCPGSVERPEWGLGGSRLHVRLIDFGIAKEFSKEGISHSSSTHVAAEATCVIDPKPQGTATYLAPEVCDAILKEKAPVRSSINDVFALGLTLYTMLFKKHPYEQFRQMGTFVVLSKIAEAKEISLPSFKLARIAERVYYHDDYFQSLTRSREEKNFSFPQCEVEDLPPNKQLDLVLLYDLVEKLLVKDASQRLRVDQLLSHPFLIDNAGSVLGSVFIGPTISTPTTNGKISNTNTNNNILRNRVMYVANYNCNKLYPSNSANATGEDGQNNTTQSNSNTANSSATGNNKSNTSNSQLSNSNSHNAHSHGGRLNGASKHPVSNTSASNSSASRTHLMPKK